ncbi:NADH dehydrogenase subunit N [Hasllibacter halocynthiae]|uniref:NADH-quinone oxidoreductase subunit N n=1 Tax=Hasllibacter halocynthiae TaxID=595589 RepID=A0A2T0X7X9_9RHOB|nr:NADH-quinone oxidoreductase subunit NuoN [Hasllibacter halocynthiae]PRY95039.1 NADH dehydrogenase subunit N [Hasllibacter halocynthiae]
MIGPSLEVILPELILALYAMGGLLLAVYTAKDRVAKLLTWVTAAVFVALAVWIGTMQGVGVGFGGMFVADGFARFAKIGILLSAAAVLLMAVDYLERRDLLRFEYPMLVTLAVVGMMVMVSSGDLIILYMGLELQSLAAYVIAAIRRDSVKSTEAGLKYFVLGALSSGLLLYGISLVYGYAGTTLYAGVFTVAFGEMPLGLLFGLVFVMSGLAFKISAAPFHMWTPDVYEGAPTPVAAFFATAPKLAAMALLARVVWDAFGLAVADWTQVIALLSVLSMILGSVAAIGQRDIKRLMAYSSIGHMGYALIGLAAGTAFGVEAMLLYMAIYIAMNVGAFAFILLMERGGRPVPDIGALGGLARYEPVRAWSMLVLMFSMAGVPPFLGFFAKFVVLQAAVAADMVWLAVIGVVASVVGAFYYLRIVYLMFFGEEADELDRGGDAIQRVMLVGSAAVMVLGMISLLGVDDAAALAAAALIAG